MEEKYDYLCSELEILEDSEKKKILHDFLEELIYQVYGYAWTQGILDGEKKPIDATKVKNLIKTLFVLD